MLDSYDVTRLFWRVRLVTGSLVVYLLCISEQGEEFFSSRNTTRVYRTSDAIRRCHPSEFVKYYNPALLETPA